MSLDVLYLSERWRPSIGSYEVSDQGRVRHRKTGTIRKLRLDPTGYYALNIWVDGVLVRRKVHQLVLEAFVCERPDGMLTRHLNGDSRDNRLENLAWGTIAENQRDMIEHGTVLRGERNHKTKLTREQVLRIRDEQGKLRDIGARYGVSSVLVSKIKRRKVWSWL